MNEYAVVNGVARAHDANGNLTFDGTNVYAFDALNRLVQVTRLSDGAVIGLYAYDHRGRRIRRTVIEQDRLDVWRRQEEGAARSSTARDEVSLPWDQATGDGHGRATVMKGDKASAVPVVGT